MSTVAVAVAGSYIAASWADSNRYRMYERWWGRLEKLERRPIREEDAVVACGWARVLIFGVGRIGEGAYDEIVAERGAGGIVVVDRNPEVVDSHQRAGRPVVRGDALDFDFWDRFRFHPEVELVFAALNSQEANLECIQRIQTFLPNARITAIARYRDQVAELREAGVDVARNLYEEAGQALAADAVSELWNSPEGD